MTGPDDIHLHGTLVACVCGAETGMTTVAFEEGYDPTECERCGKPVDRWGDTRPWRRVERHQIGCICHPKTERCQLCGGVMVSGLVDDGDGPWHFRCSPGVVTVRDGETLSQAEARARDVDEGIETPPPAAMSDPDPLAEIKQALEQPGLGFGVELQECGHEWVTWLVGEVERLRALLEPSVTMTSPHVRESGNEEGPPSRS